MSKQDEYHTVVISYLGDGKGKTETYYYGEAKAPIEPIKDFSQMRFTKGASINEILADFTWKARIKNLFYKFTK
jgi:hypothetical protein